MQQAGELIDLVQAPVGTLVEEIDGTRIVHADLPIEGEILVLLHSQHPKPVPVWLSAAFSKNAAIHEKDNRNCDEHHLLLVKLIFEKGLL